MTQQRSGALQLRAKLARSGRGLGLAPTSNFLWFDLRAKYKKYATVATVALLAVLLSMLFTAMNKSIFLYIHY